MKQSDKRFHTIDGETLMSQAAPAAELCGGLSALSGGLHILSRSEFIGTPTEAVPEDRPRRTEGITPEEGVPHDSAKVLTL